MTMEFTNFTTLVREEVERRTGENYRVRINDVRKNRSEEHTSELQSP